MKYEKIIYPQNTVLWNKIIVNKTKILRVKLLVQSVMLYGVGMWTIGDHESSRYWLQRWSFGGLQGNQERTKFET